MASSLQTLVKILRLEQEKDYQNTAVIGGFARFAFHWAKEAHSQARSDEHHALVDLIADKLREYETADSARRAELVQDVIGLAGGQPAPAAPERPIREDIPEVSTVEPVGEVVDLTLEGVAEDEAETEPDVESSELDSDDFLAFVPSVAVEAPVPLSVRERRGYAHKPPTPADAHLLDRLQAPLTEVSGIGTTRAEQLEKLGARTVYDLLRLFPRRYDDFSRMKLIKDLTPGEEITVIGTLSGVEVKRTSNGGTRVEALLDDGSAALKLNWFNQPWMEKQLEKDEHYVVSGKVDQYLGRLVMNSPEVEPLEREALHAGRIVPVYSLTKGISARQMRRLMKGVLDEWALHLPDQLPLETRERGDLMDYDDAIVQAHFPDTWDDMLSALHRLAFDELIVLHLAMLQRRYQWQSRSGTPLPVDESWTNAFIDSLPFALTDAQRRAIRAIQSDMAQDIPMNRLLQGDVGSGKTIVAALAMGAAIENGMQAALMAPTSILAEQHYANISGTLARSPLGEGVRVALLTGHISQGERDAIYTGLADGSIHAVIGTHALIQEGVSFHNLGLAVIDEQHRFGVLQRGFLRGKADGRNPHLLVMTATPIPRTLALTVHADLDLTVIDEMPPGRQPVSTRVLQPKERERAYSFIRSQVQKGRQAYVICPLVEDSDKTEARSAIAEHTRLQNDVFPELRLGLLHGRLSAAEKEDVMERFYRGEIDVLVSTTVIEVGIDVPNATTILIENAPRFGLAQLHQLRGRVGRGEHESYCLLLSDRPFLDVHEDERLAILEQTNDGFKLAEKDWELRGAGDLLGTQQSGFGRIDLANLMDSKLVAQVQEEAHRIYERDPLLTDPEHILLARSVSALSHEFGDVS